MHAVQSTIPKDGFGTIGYGCGCRTCLMLGQGLAVSGNGFLP